MPFILDSDPVCDEACRLISGFLIKVNTGLMLWSSKNLFTFEMSVFGSGFIAMKQGIDALRCLRHKLIMMGIFISGSSSIYENNMSIVLYTFKPESVLRWKAMQFIFMQSVS